MYCPKCGSNQDAGKRFCTVCGTNLQVVNQVLINPLPQPAPAYPSAFDLARQRESSKALRLALIGGGLIAYKFFSFAFSGGSMFGFLTVLGFILLVSGITKMASMRTPAPYPIVPQPSAPSVAQPQSPPPLAPPRPVFSATTNESPSRNTNELEPISPPAVSATEDETRHLPQ